MLRALGCVVGYWRPGGRSWMLVHKGDNGGTRAQCRKARRERASLGSMTPLRILSRAPSAAATGPTSWVCERDRHPMQRGD
jgi:hypothetical protein